MTRKLLLGTVSLMLFSLLLTGCKLPASTAPEIPEEEMMTTPILIVTEAPVSQTPTAMVLDPDAEAEEPLTPEPTDIPEPTVMVPTVTRPAEYTLRDGEFPFCIARRFDLDPQELLSLNNLGPNTFIEPGTTLQIPQTGTWPGEDRSLRPHPTTHTVTAGETIYSIACFYGPVTPEAIIAVNQLEEPFELTTGQSLSIP